MKLEWNAVMSNKKQFILAFNISFNFHNFKILFASILSGATKIKQMIRSVYLLLSGFSYFKEILIF